ncbi:hypothetical protein HK102_011323 [Quaeritorhiza haematococci]|nr:hypothetical protein HK102_011323 [Quaeritorhiza haematococci]
METKVTTGSTHPYWLDDPNFKGQTLFGPLQENLETEVIIVGAGISGLTTAYLLTRAGKRVVVLEDGQIASGETGRTTAHLAFGLDDHYCVLSKLHGAEGARMAAESHSAAIDMIEKIVKTHGIDCGFERVNGYLMSHVPSTARAYRKEAEPLLKREYHVAREDARITDVELLLEAPIPLAKTFPIGIAVKFPRQAQIQPLSYMQGLARVLRDEGRMAGGSCNIFTDTHAEKMEGGKGTAKVVTRDGRTVVGQHLVLATNVPLTNRLVLWERLEPYRTYVIAAEVPNPSSHTKALFWDTADPYHYVRYTSDMRTIIIGGEDHLVGQQRKGERVKEGMFKSSHIATEDTSFYEERYKRLEDWARERFDMGKVIAKWSGQIIEPVDGLAYIGRNPMDADNVYVITGDSGNGMTHGTLGAQIIHDLILDRPNPWAKLYDPSRAPSIRNIPEMFKHLADANWQYKRWLRRGDVNTIDELAPDSGAVMTHGASKPYAVYKDKEGGIHTCTAVCPHMNGIVTWNAEEKTWDCPVHGSRFDRYGRVLNGPASSNLETLDVDWVKG